MSDRIVPELRNSTSAKPDSLKGKLSIGFGFSVGAWVQSRSRWSNLNVFSRILSAAEMIKLTRGGKGCKDEGDYLSWKNMEWTLKGDWKIGEVVKEELCNHDASNTVYLTAAFRDAYTCQRCKKYFVVCEPGLG